MYATCSGSAQRDVTMQKFLLDGVARTDAALRQGRRGAAEGRGTEIVVCVSAPRGTSITRGCHGMDTDALGGCAQSFLSFRPP
eukprot:1053889-Prymnesium_polylepis.1